MKRGGLATLAALLLALGFGQLRVDGAHGQVPALLPLHGVLSNADAHPIDGEVQVVFALYSSAEGGEPLYSETHTLRVEQGRFALLLGQHQALDPRLFAELSELFVGVRVEEDDEATPRMRVGTVPFAAAAEIAHQATTLDGVGVDELQRRVVGSCDNGEAMVAVASDGQVRCSTIPGATGPRGPAGPQGPEGPQGPAGPQGAPGEAGPVASFDCAGNAVSAVDAAGRPTCIPLATASVTAGAGLVVDGCEGSACQVSIAPDAVGMAQTSLPMETGFESYQVLVGDAFYPAGTTFVPDSDGQCMLMASVEVDDAMPLSSGRFAFRVGYLEDAVAGSALLSLATFLARPADGLAAGSGTAHLVVPVTAGRSYRFGCAARASGPWVGKEMWCQVSRLCQ